jgi:predicted AlkP superfamily phosphohydrolase/phosphomutase
VETGVSGDVHALWPPYWSTPAWGAILTGYDQEQLGVHEDLGAAAPGLPPFEVPLTLDLASNPVFLAEFSLIQAGVIEPAPISRDELPKPPVWERISQAGKRTAVVFFSFTYPARGQSAYVVSNRVEPDLWSRFGVKPGQREFLASPANQSASLLKWFSGNEAAGAVLGEEFLPRMDWPQPQDAAVDPVAVLREASDVEFRVLNLTKDLIHQDRGLDAVMMYSDAFDSISHAYYPYRFPEDFPLRPPAPADVATLGPVMDRYLEWFDGRLGELIRSFPTPPNVIVVSDHGVEAANHVTLWRGWHSPHGMFLAAGPGITHDAKVRDVSYFDIVPTILDLLDLKPAVDLRGHSVVGIGPSVVVRASATR